MQPRGAADDAERGAVIPLVALVMSTLIIFTSLALDLGYQRIARRDMQALADVVALDLARSVDGRTAAQIEADPNWTAARTQSVARNGDTVGSTPAVTATLGVVDATTGAFTAVTGSSVPDAVRVSAATSVDFFFRPGSGGASRTAIGSQVPRANFMIGSFLAGSDPDLDLELLDRILPRRIGSTLDRLTNTSSVSLTAVSYRGLANTQVDLTRVGIELGAGSPDRLVSAGAYNARGVYLATARVMDQSGSTAAATVFRAMAAETSSTATIDFADIFLRQGGSSQLAGGTNLSIGALAFLNSSVNAIGGNSFVSIPNFNLGIPGITSTTLTVDLIEAPQFCAIPNALCKVGDSVTTSQVRVRLDNNLTLNLDLPPLLNPLVTGTLTTETTAAGATGTITAARCSAGTGLQGVDIGVVSAPITTTVSDVLAVQATVLGLATTIANAGVSNRTAAASGTGGSASFAYPSEFLPTEGTGTTKRVGSPSLGLATALNLSSANVTLVGVQPVTTGEVVNSVNLALAPTIASLENFIVRRLARTLGLYLGGADIGAIDLKCGGVGLAG